MNRQQAKRRANEVARSDWMDKAARVGFLAKGAIYAIIGIFALRLAVGDGGALLDPRQATEQVAVQPFGKVLLVLLGVGLACYALWRLLQAALDPDGAGHQDSRAKHLAKRVGRAASGVIHGFLAITAFQMLTGGGAGGGSRSWLHRILEWQGGRWLIIAVGVFTIGAGLQQLYRAYTARFRKHLRTGEMSPEERTWAVRLGQFGLAARGVVLPIVGWFFIKAGLEADASEAQGTGAALGEIASQMYGAVLLAVVAAGFIAYAFYMAVNARYRKPLTS